MAKNRNNTYAQLTMFGKWVQNIIRQGERWTGEPSRQENGENLKTLQNIVEQKTGSLKKTEW